MKRRGKARQAGAGQPLFELCRRAHIRSPLAEVPLETAGEESMMCDAVATSTNGGGSHTYV
jgi:hypothetical protein